jgi:hypothetical protein
MKDTSNDEFFSRNPITFAVDRIAAGAVAERQHSSISSRRKVNVLVDEGSVFLNHHIPAAPGHIQGHEYRCLRVISLQMEL